MLLDRMAASGHKLYARDERKIEVTLTKKDELIADWMIENEEDWLAEFEEAFGYNAELEFTIVGEEEKPKSTHDYFMLWLEDEFKSLSDEEKPVAIAKLSKLMNSLTGSPDPE
jgi:DNA-binding MarR family transcriptional regulator